MIKGKPVHDFVDSDTNLVSYWANGTINYLDLRYQEMSESTLEVVYITWHNISCQPQFIFHSSPTRVRPCEKERETGKVVPRGVPPSPQREDHMEQNVQSQFNSSSHTGMY